jgi:hypothetical protein
MVIAGVEETIEVLADNHLCSKVSKYYKRIFVSLYVRASITILFFWLSQIELIVRDHLLFFLCLPSFPPLRYTLSHGKADRIEADDKFLRFLTKTCLRCTRRWP